MSGVHSACGKDRTAIMLRSTSPCSFITARSCKVLLISGVQNACGLRQRRALPCCDYNTFMWSAYYEWHAQCVWAKIGQRSRCAGPRLPPKVAQYCEMFFMSGIHNACGPRQGSGPTA
eukprot:scaffold62433_cov48-Tisochrysis_lutea.AAC.2